MHYSHRHMQSHWLVWQAGRATVLFGGPSWSTVASLRKEGMHILKVAVFLHFPITPYLLKPWRPQMFWFWRWRGNRNVHHQFLLRVVAIVGLFYDISSTETRSIYSVHLLVVAVQMVPVGALVVGQ